MKYFIAATIAALLVSVYWYFRIVDVQQNLNTALKEQKQLTQEHIQLSHDYAGTLYAYKNVLADRDSAQHKLMRHLAEDGKFMERVVKNSRQQYDDMQMLRDIIVLQDSLLQHQ